eukprot:7582370-Pyramimonas_sp.AAC.1
MRQVTRSLLLSSRGDIPANEVGKKFGGPINDEEQRRNSCGTTLKLLGAMGFGSLSPRGGAPILLRPSSEEEVGSVASDLATMYQLDREKVQKKLKE